MLRIMYARTLSTLSTRSAKSSVAAAPRPLAAAATLQTHLGAVQSYHFIGASPLAPLPLTTADRCLLREPPLIACLLCEPVRSFQLKGSVLLTVWPQMAVCAGIAVFATILRAAVGEENYIIKDVKGHATLGTALAFLNVFRSNLSYGRYWDGRGQLGVLVKSGRELMRLVVTYTKVPEDPEEEGEMAECCKDVWRLISCLMHSIVLAVQNFSGHFVVPAYDIDTELVRPGWLKEKEKTAIEKAEAVGRDTPDNKGRPALIAALLSHKIYYMYHRGWMNAAVLKKCDKCINDFVGAWMACEKIVGVPVSLQSFPYLPPPLGAGRAAPVTRRPVAADPCRQPDC